MNSLKQFFYNPTCFRCGSWFVEKNLFCESCFNFHIAPRAQIKRRTVIDNNQTFEHLYLFDWISGESNLLSGLVHQLKGSRCTAALYFYGNLLARQILAGQHNIAEFGLVVPLPGSTKASVHSHLLGEQISDCLSLPTLNILTKEVNQKSQKQRNLHDRKDVIIGLLPSVATELITSLKNEKPKVVYVDDILTTGSTFKAARAALGLKQKACILTIFYRPPKATHTLGPT